MKRKLMSLLTCLFIGIGLLTAQTQTVTGTVISEEDGQPIIGAAVSVKGTAIGGITDFDGKFALANVPASATTLKVSYLGMQEQEVTIKPNLKVVMKSSIEEIEEVVIIGYGTGKKLGTVAGSISRVKNDKFEKVPTANFTDALSGQVSGLSSLSSSGDPSAVTTIRLRGVNTINAGKTPLYILDGAPISPDMFNTLNPNDIENVTVLKDASSASIYGSRAANGVIVITSKKGKFGQKASITVRAQYGFSKMVKDNADMMNSSQYIDFRDKIGQPVSQDIKDLVAKHGISTNWREETFDKNAPTYTLDASISGGNDGVRYYLSLNHHEQEGIIDQSGMRRETLRFNMEARVRSWMKVGLQSNLGYHKYENNSEVAAAGLYRSSPTLFSRIALPYDSPRYYTFDDQGNIVWGEKAQMLRYSGLTSPWFVNEKREVQRRNVTANVNLFQEFTPVKGLTVRAQQAVDAYDYTISNAGYPYDGFKTPMGQEIAGTTGYRQESFSRYYSFTYTNTAEYKFDICSHNITLLAGQESIISKQNSFGVFTQGHTDARQLRLIDAATVSTADLSHSIIEAVYNSYFFTGGYNYDSRYYLDLSFRRDGSSRFAPGNRWSSFFSVGGMWDIRRERFMDGMDWLNELSLKASYGETGNSMIGDYRYFGLVGTGDNTYDGRATIGIKQAGNSDLAWEKVESFNTGLSFRVFDRLSVSAEYYSKKTKDMLMTIPYSYTTGHASGWGNVGVMTNKGVDLDVNVDVVKNSQVYWGFKANFNYNKNRITELFDGLDEFIEEGTGLKYTVGHSLGELFYVRYAGVDPRDGTQMWYDKDGNLTKTFNEERDRVMLGKDRYAPYSGGFGTEVRWKGFTLSADFYWQAKKYMINNDNYFIENSGFGTSHNQSANMLNIWTQPGQVTNIPKYGEQVQFDDRLVENASFLRLKNVTLQYSLPKSLLKKTGMIERANLFFIGRNLLTFTNYSGYDPEPDSNIGRFWYPNTRQYVFGIEVSF